MTHPEIFDAKNVPGTIMKAARKLKHFLHEPAEKGNVLTAHPIVCQTSNDAKAIRPCAQSYQRTRFVRQAGGVLGLLHAFGLLAAIPASVAAQPLAQPMAFHFTVIGSSLGTTPKAADLRAALSETDTDNLAFVVVHGIKPPSESCKDDVYLQRRQQLQEAKNGVIVSLVGSDWAQCSTPRGRSNAVERLNRLREFFFIGDFSLGATKLPLMRQSASPQFRGIGENARWEVGNVLFATVNLPGKNNRYLTDAGRNSEFEDRLVANRAWLKRLMTIAAYRKFGAVVLFADGDPITHTKRRMFASDTSYDGYADVRSQLKQSAATYAGKILIVHGQPSAGTSSKPGGIRWHGNLGTLDTSAGLVKIAVDPAADSLFSVHRETKRVPDTAPPE